MDAEFLDLPKDVQDVFLAITKLLKDYGPRLGRQYVDTLKGSNTRT
jgi:hypothetical protein